MRSSRARWTGVECSPWRFQATRQLLKLWGSKDGRLHDQAEVGAPRGEQQAITQLGGATSGQQSSFQQSFTQVVDPATHASGKGAQQGACSLTPTHAVFSSDGQQEDLYINTTMVPPVSSVSSRGRQPLEAGAPVPAWHALQTNEVTV